MSEGVLDADRTTLIRFLMFFRERDGISAGGGFDREAARIIFWKNAVFYALHAMRERLDDFILYYRSGGSGELSGR